MRNNKIYEVYRLFYSKEESKEKGRPIFHTMQTDIRVKDDEMNEENFPTNCYILKVVVTEKGKRIGEDYVIGDDRCGELCAYRLIYQKFGYPVVSIKQLVASGLILDIERKIATIEYQIPCWEG